MTEVLLSERARDRLADLDPDVRERIKDALRALQPDRDLSQLSGADVYKYRVGDYRVIADWDRKEEKVYVLTVGHRSTVYDRGW